MTNGTMILIDAKNIPHELCMDKAKIMQTCKGAMTKAGATVLSEQKHDLPIPGHESPEGTVGCLLIDMSQVYFHTFAITGRIAFTIHTCGDIDCEKVANEIKKKLGIHDFQQQMVERA